MFKRLLLIFAFIPTLMWAQSTTPNIGLQIPATGSNNWYIPLNYDFSRLDLYLSGNAGIPGLLVNGNVNITGTLTAGQITGTGGSVFATAASAGQYSPVYYSQNPTGTAFAGVAPFTGFAYYLGNAPPRAATQTNLITLMGGSTCGTAGTAFSPQAADCIAVGTGIGTINTGATGNIAQYTATGTVVGPATGTNTFLYLNGSSALAAPTTANLNTLLTSGVVIGGGTINGTIIGGTTAAAITGTTITGTTLVGSGSGITALNGANISSGNIAIARIATALTTPGPIGGTTSSSGTFTTVTASGLNQAKNFEALPGNIWMSQDSGGAGLNCFTFNNQCGIGAGNVGMIQPIGSTVNLFLSYGASGNLSMGNGSPGAAQQFVLSSAGNIALTGLISSSAAAPTSATSSAISSSVNCGTSNLNCLPMSGHFTAALTGGGSAGNFAVFTYGIPNTSVNGMSCVASGFTTSGTLVAAVSVAATGTSNLVLTFGLNNSAVNATASTITVSYVCFNS
jgi:hypothetical protein